MASSNKSGRKSGKRPGTFRGRGDARNGHGPKKGAPNAGRPPDVFRAEMQRLALLPAALTRLEGLLKDKKIATDLFLRAYQFVSERSFGKPMQGFEDPAFTPEEREARVRALLGIKLASEER